MNRLATTSHRRFSLSIAVSLDLADDAQRRVHELIQRFHPRALAALFRCLGMRQVDGVVFEAIQWLRIEPPQFALVRYRPMATVCRGSAIRAAKPRLLFCRTPNSDRKGVYVVEIRSAVQWHLAGFRQERAVRRRQGAAHLRRTRPSSSPSS